jgi:hypothetical protein
MAGAVCFGQDEPETEKTELKTSLFYPLLHPCKLFFWAYGAEKTQKDADCHAG